MNFHQEIINNYSDYFKKVYNQDTYPNQNDISCEFITKACIARDPDFAFDIGTSYGASALSTAYALKQLGKDESLLTMIDIDFTSWDKSISDIQKDLLKKYNINPNKIKRIHEHFYGLDPKILLPEGKKFFIFYDIHDIEGQFSLSRRFLAQWLPRVKNGLMAFHDMSVVDESYVPIDEEHVVSRHFTGKLLSGFKECTMIVDWLNRYKINFASVPDTSIIYISADK